MANIDCPTSSLPGVVLEGQSGYRECSVTLMDTSDPEIRFNGEGASHWAFEVYPRLLKRWNPRGNPSEYSEIIRRIRSEGRSRKYDCVLGLSGGVDSSYLALLAWKANLRALIVHTDTGWNSEEAVHNIDRIINRCGFPLVTFVVDWEEMASLQRAFLRSGVPNQDIPQDHAIFAGLYRQAVKYGIKWVLSGSNYSCESVLPRAWVYSHRDKMHIQAINSIYGDRPLKRFPLMGQIKYRIGHLALRGMKTACLLNMVEYRQAEAIDELRKEFEWKEYGGKHCESRWTRYYQKYYLRKRFGFDKRRAHLSSLILSGQISRRAAVDEFASDDYSIDLMRSDGKFVRTKLGYSEGEWMSILNLPVRSHKEYPTGARLQAVLSWLKARSGLRDRDYGV